jgi:uncharacterized protein YkwD
MRSPLQTEVGIGAADGKTASDQIARCAGVYPSFPTNLRFLIVASSALVAFAAQTAAADELGVSVPSGSPAEEMAIEQALLDRTNSDREANGLLPLAFDVETLGIARQRAAEQLDRPSLSHYNAMGYLAFVDLLAAASLKYQLAGENLARVKSYQPSLIDDVEGALMSSPPHRRNILENEFTRLAIGAATDGQGQVTFAEVYRD